MNFLRLQSSCGTNGSHHLMFDGQREGGVNLGPDNYVRSKIVGCRGILGQSSRLYVYVDFSFQEALQSRTKGAQRPNVDALGPMGPGLGPMGPGA